MRTGKHTHKQNTHAHQQNKHAQLASCKQTPTFPNHTRAGKHAQKQEIHACAQAYPGTLKCTNAETYTPHASNCKALDVRVGFILHPFEQKTTA
jgi:hypothetical protein